MFPFKTRKKNEREREREQGGCAHKGGEAKFEVQKFLIEESCEVIVLSEDAVGNRCTNDAKERKKRTEKNVSKRNKKKSLSSLLRLLTVFIQLEGGIGRSSVDLDNSLDDVSPLDGLEVGLGNGEDVGVEVVDAGEGPELGEEVEEVPEPEEGEEDEGEGEVPVHVAEVGEGD